MISTKKERVSWYLYDWANSAFYTTVVTVFLGPYLTEIAKNASVNQYLSILGMDIHYASFFPYMASLSVLLQAIFLPISGAIADYTRRKKLILGLFAYIGSFATLGLYFLEGQRYLLGGLLFVIANLSFGISVVVYNSYLNEIAEEKDRDKVSSIGWGIGYLGGGLMLAINLFIFTSAESFGLDSGHAVRICLASSGVWWALFTLPAMRYLRKGQYLKLEKGQRLLSIGFKQMIHTLKEMPKYPKTLHFLIAYLIYNDGVQTVILMSAAFGSEELGLSLDVLTTVILIVQFVAFFGAFLFKYVANLLNAKQAILICLVIWSLGVIYAYSYLQTELDFYILAIVVGTVMGGTQALSRSLYSNLIPKGKEAEYFSIYEISERGTSWLGPMIFGLSLQFTSSYRLAILSLISFFVLGFIALKMLNVNKAIAESKK